GDAAGIEGVLGSVPRCRLPAPGVLGRRWRPRPAGARGAVDPEEPSMMLLALASAVLAQSPTTFPSTETRSESPRSMITEIRLGSYYPWVDRPLSNCYGASCPYAQILKGSMLLVELEVERELFQAFGSASVGLTIGYA